MVSYFVVQTLPVSWRAAAWSAFARAKGWLWRQWSSTPGPTPLRSPRSLELESPLRSSWRERKLLSRRFWSRKTKKSSSCREHLIYCNFFSSFLNYKKIRESKWIFFNSSQIISPKNCQPVWPSMFWKPTGPSEKIPAPGQSTNTFCYSLQYLRIIYFLKSVTTALHGYTMPGPAIFLP